MTVTVMMKIYRLTRTQLLPIGLREAWEFFSSPKNLAVITPKKMNFVILTMSGGDTLYPGQIISYKVTVLPLVRLRWVTEITHVQEPNYFADEQRFGPYALWHHKHHFKTVEGGVEMIDEVDYAISLGFLGRLAHFFFVGRAVNRIFDHRYQTLESYFSKKK